MPNINIDRLDLGVSGVDAATVRQALGALPSLLPDALSAARAGDAAPAGDGVARVGAGASSGELARAIAGAVAARLHGAMTPRDGGGR